MATGLCNSRARETARSPWVAPVGVVHSPRLPLALTSFSVPLLPEGQIDEAAWSSLYSTKSRPFTKPASGKIAVKVINHYGDEVLKVLSV